MPKRFHGSSNMALALDHTTLAEQLRSPMPQPGTDPKKALFVKYLKLKANERRQRMSSSGDNKEKTRDEV